MTKPTSDSTCIAPLPCPERGHAFPLGWDSTRESLLYPHGKAIYIRSVHNPDQCEIYAEHTATTTVAKASPSGHYVASGDISGELRVWALSNPDRSFTLKYAGKVLACPIRDLSWDADSTRVAVVGVGSSSSSSGDNNLGLVVTFDSGNKVGELLGHTKTVNAVAFDPSGKRPLTLATASDDGRVNTYKGTPMKFEASHDHHNSRFVHSVVYSPDGSSFITVGSDGTAQLHDGPTSAWSNQIFQLAGASIYAAAWNPESTHVWLGCADGTGRLIDVASRKIIQEISLSASKKSPLDRQAVSVLWVYCKSKQEDRIFSLSASGKVSVLRRDPSNNTVFQLVGSIEGHTQSIVELLIAEDSVLVTRDSEDVLCTSQASGQKWESRRLSLECNATRCMAILDSFVYRVLEDSTLEKLTRTGEFVASWVLPVRPSKLVVLGSEASTLLYLVDKTISLFNCTEGSVKKQNSLLSTISCVAYHKPSNLILAGCQDGSFHLLCGDTLKTIASKAVSSSDLTCINVRDDTEGSLLLAVGDANRTIRVYKWASSVLTTLIEHEWVFHSSRITGLAWLLDGTGRLASIALDQRLILWDPAHPNSPVFTKANAHNNAISGLVAMPGQSCVVTGSLDGCIRFWQC